MHLINLFRTCNFSEKNQVNPFLKELNSKNLKIEISL